MNLFRRSCQFSKIGWKVPSGLFEVAGPILCAKDSLVVYWVHELLQILEHCIEFVLGLLLVVSVSLVDFILQVLLDCTCQAGIRLVYGSLYVHEPGEACLHVASQNRGVVQVMRCDME